MRIWIDFETETYEKEIKELAAKVKAVKSNEEYFNLLNDYSENAVVAAMYACGRISADNVIYEMEEAAFEFIASQEYGEEE